jgi:hypothetical protein
MLGVVDVYIGVTLACTCLALGARVSTWVIVPPVQQQQQQRSLMIWSGMYKRQPAAWPCCSWQLYYSCCTADVPSVELLSP